MKRLNLMFLIIGVAVIFSGCSKDDSLAPLSQNDQETNLKAKKVPTHFTGDCNIIIPPSIDGNNEWYDLTDDERVTGVTIWLSDPMVPIDEITFELSGTAELLVGAEVGDYEYDGKWETSWWGTQTMTDTGFRIVAHAVGTGTEGNVLGLTAKWKYTMDYVGGFPVNPFDDSFKYVIKGKITEVL